MNRICCLICSRVTNTWIAVFKNAGWRRQSGRRALLGRKAIVAALSLACTPGAFAAQSVAAKQPEIAARTLQPCIPPGCEVTAAGSSLQPVGGQVVSGSASIAQSGNTTTIRQSSPDLVLNWQSFSIGSQETVDFLQPSASAIAVNRILGTTGSQILGHLDANGQVWLINPNGVLFGQGAQVNVGGLVASVLGVSDLNLSSNAISFGGNGTGSVVNQGTIATASGGYVALLANHISNQGTITAKLGTVALGAGSATSLTFSGNSLVKMQVDQSTLNNLAENGGLIHADGGTVIMSAGARNALLASVVNNTGVIEARTVENHNGTIELLGGMTAGTVNVGGTLDASAPDGGNGGSIESSAAHVEVANDARVTTVAAAGKTGTWLIDPTDFTVAPSGGDMSGATLSGDLNSTNFTILSSSGISPVTGDPLGQGGNINVNDNVSWSANTTLTLTASNNVNVNANIIATGNTAGLLINPNTANGSQAANGTGAFNLAMGNSITLSGTNPSLSIAGNAYTVINSLGAAGSTTGTDLQGINGNLSGYYALGTNIDATGTSSWNGGAGFTPIGNSTSNFTGTFNGLGNTISNVTINLPSASDYVGLFGETGASAVIQNVGLVGGSVSGNAGVGGLVGYNFGTVTSSYATASVSGSRILGGLAGLNGGTVTSSYATGSVSAGPASYGVGGLVGFNDFGTVNNSYATGSVSGASDSEDMGGLVGSNIGAASTVSNSYATGSVSGAGGTQLGGLVGANQGAISNSYATGSVSGASGSEFGGLVGFNNSIVTNSYAAGGVSGSSSLVGGLVGFNYGGSVSNSYWNTDNNAPGTSGIGAGTTTGATGLTTAQMQTASNFTGFTFTTTPAASGNNWVIVDTDGTLNNAGSAPGATFPMLASEYSTTIINTHQLQLMAMNTAASYTLGQNINASATGSGGDVWGSSGFVPIGNSTIFFTGTFNGLGYTISNLTINLPGASGVGLFGWTGTTSVIQNVGLVGESVSGYFYVGGLVGLNSGATVNNSYATGNVSGNYFVGGLVGENGNGTVSNSYTTGSVSGSDYVGGLVGENFSTVSNSYATGSVSGTNYVGGLVGRNDATVGNSYATGNVMGSYDSDSIGGLVGGNGGTISNSYATGSVSGASESDAVGGLAGENGGTVSNSYATGSVSGASGSGYVGGLVGDNFRGTVSNSYWDTTTSGQSTSAGGTGLTTAQLSGALPTGFDPTVWGNVNNQTTPYLLTNPGPVYIGSDSTHLFSLVFSLSQLQAINNNLAGDFALATSLNASGVTNWVPLGTDGAGNVINSGSGFSGIFDGLGNTLSNLTINLPSANYVGPFGYAGTGSVIQNVGLVGGSVSGSGWVGGLVGENDGTVSTSYATGSLSGATRVGGLVGENDGTVSNSYATGSMSTGVNSGPIGGLVGINSGTVSTSYATGNVSGASGSTQLGGLVGASFANIVNSYSTGSVSGSTYVGGLVGLQAGSVIGSAVLTTALLSGALPTGFVPTVWGNVNNQTTPYLLTNPGPVYIGSDSTHLFSLVFNLSQMQGINNNLAGDFALATSLNASGVTNWVPLGTDGAGNAINSGSGFSGIFDGLGNTISNLTINLPSTNDVGLFGYSSGTIRNIGIVGGSVSGANDVGGLVGQNNYQASISNSYATGTVSGAGNSSYVGGLVGLNGNSVSNSYATGSVTAGSGSSSVGGLVGGSSGPVGNSYATGSVTAGGGSSSVGGLVGLNYQASISNSYATGYASGSSSVGGLVGDNAGGNASIRNSYATGAAYLTGSSSGLGGLVGNNSGTINNSYATGFVDGAYGSDLGGLVGVNSGTINNSYATGEVFGYTSCPSGCYVPTNLGGLVGNNSGTVSNSYATGFVDGYGYYSYTYYYGCGFSTCEGIAYVGAQEVGGLVGFNSSAINNSYATGGVSTSSYSFGVGGLVGGNSGGTIINTYASGSVSGSSDVGGLVGYNDNGGTISNSFWDTTTSGQTAPEPGATGLTTAQMQTASSFTGWSIATTGGSGDVWRIYEGNTFPLLISFLTPLTLTDAPDATVTYNGTTQSGATTAISGVLGAAATGTNAGFYNGYYSTQQGYDITGGNLTIDPASLTLSGTRVYDGTTIVAGSILTATGVAGQTFSVTGAGSSSNLVTANVQTDSTLATVTGLTLGSSSNGGLSSNYYPLSTTGSSITITPLALAVAGATVANKVYNGTTTATLSAGTLVGVISGDTVTLTQSGTFASKNVGTGIAVTATDTIGGASAGNYTLTEPTGLTGRITPLAITVAATAQNKIYDGNTTAVVTLASSGVIAGDIVTFTDASATFANKNVGTAKTVSVKGISASGANASDYTSNTTATTTANITPAALTVTGETANNKVYNGTTTATLSAGTLAGVISGDTVTLTQSGTFASKNVGTGIAVTATDTIGGASAGNYTLTEPTGFAANITPKALTVTGTKVSTEVYNGTTTATLTGGTLAGVVSGDTVTLTQSGTFASKNVGTGIAVTATDTIGGASAGNYTLTEPTGLTGRITPLAITVAATAQNKIYDGNTTAVVTLASSGVIAGDIVTFTDTSATFASAAVGTWTVTAKGIAIIGANASDYSLQNAVATTTASILP